MTDLVETVNRGHEAFLKKLESIKVSDSSFCYWLSSAALNVCETIKNDKLQGKLKKVDALRTKVKRGFEKMKDFLGHLSEEERDHLEYCQARFTQVTDEKPNKPDKVEAETPYELRSKGSIASKRGVKLEHKERIATNLKNWKTPDDLEGQENVSAACAPQRVKRKAGSITVVIVIMTTCIASSVENYF